MFKIKPFMLFGLNIFIMAASWVCHDMPRQDEYLFIFMISLVFIMAPFVMSFRQQALLVIINAFFLLFYGFMGILNRIDVVVFITLFMAVGGASYMVRSLSGAFDEAQEAEIKSRQRKYNSLVSELESIDRRGKKVETELGRISRLYEITKKLAPALRFDDLFDALLVFLEENFRFDAAHLLIFSDGEFVRGTSRAAGDAVYDQDPERALDYEKVSEYCTGHDLNSLFLTSDEYQDVFDELRVRSGSLMLFPLFVGEELCAILAIEGAQRSMYGRFRILVSQIALEFRKVQLYERVQELSIVDGLTEVYLRRHLMERLEEEVERSGRLGLNFSVGMLDIDHFKNCNDKYGHLVGDAVLKKIADRLKRSVREVDLIARYGGEEFCVLLPETNKELAMAVAQRIRRSIESKGIKAYDEELRVTASIGISTYPEDGTGIDILIEKADTALYKAKRKGRNRVCTT
jgi:diguanylate cyclase (GGDEF)-like protein